jgi:iron complex outermembrane receptor protein
VNNTCFIGTMSRCVAVLLLTLTAGIRPGIAAADLGTRFDFNIPPQSLPSALLQFAHQSGVQITSAGSLVEGKSSPGVVGRFDGNAALSRLLRDTALSYDIVNAKTVVITGGASAGSTATSAASTWAMTAAADQAAAGKQPDPVPNPADRSRLHLAQLGSGQASGDLPVSATGAQTASASDEPKLEQIVVTAQKRAENLQSVPVSVEVIGRDQLSQQNQNSFADLSQTVPSLHIATGNKSNTLSLRGISSGAGNPGFDQAVATFSDDIYHGRSRLSNTTFLDLDRIEVLKGPQSTFFGNNAIAGALNVVSRKPTDTWEGNMRVLAGMFEQYALEAAGGGPLTDTVGARLAVTANGDERGWLDNINTDQHIPRIHNLAGRLTLDYKPLEDLEATLKMEAGHHKTEGAAVDQPLQWFNCPLAPYPSSYGGLGACATALTVGIPQGLRGNTVDTLQGEGNDLQNQESVLTLNYNRWGQSFTSISGFSRYDFLEDSNSALPVPNLQAEWTEHYHQFSQELRVASASNQPLEYLAGVYFQTDRLNYDQINTFSFLGPLFDGIPTLAPYSPWIYRQGIRQDEDIYSFFGSLTWNATERLKLSAGLRGTRVSKSYAAHLVYGSSASLYGQFVEDPPDIQQEIVSVLGMGGSASLGTSQTLEQSSHALLPSARVQYQLTQDAMAYFRYDRGFLAGGFNGADVFDFGNVSQFGPEHVNAYELGVKSKWFDDRVLLNADVFLSDYTDLQVSDLKFTSSAIGNGFINEVANAAKSRSRGIELEGQWAATRDVRLGANITYLNARFTSFPNSAPNTLQTYCLGLTQASYAATSQCAAYPFPVPQVEDLSGQPTPFAPSWSGSLTAAYSVSLPRDLKFTTEIDPYFTTRYESVSGEPLSAIAGYVRLDARMTLEPYTGHWAFDLIGKNLTDRAIIVYSVPVYNFSKEQPWNVAAQFRYRW